MHSMHQAGGYEHMNYTRRNWVDIIKDITIQARKVSVGAVSGSMTDDNNIIDSSVSLSVASKNGFGMGMGSGTVPDVVCPWPLLWE